VLRLYTSTGGRGLDTTEDSPLARELALNDLVHTSVPVPRILRAEPEAEPPWALLEFVDGERFDLALTKMSEFELRQVSRAVGEVLARIHAFEFSEPGFFGSRLEIVQALRGSWLGSVVESMSNGRSRIRDGADLADRLLRVIAEHGSRLEPFWDEARLVHADYKPWNLLVQRTGAAWNLAAVLDWEFAFAGPPLCDFGIYLRYRDRHPVAYTDGFLEGYGSMPDDALRLARLIDLVSVCTFLERPANDATIAIDMQRVILATLDAFSQ
jgi:aminoglycoside phosphotransferase (APT) family kinase protein